MKISEKKQRQIMLGWRILEAKYVYYLSPPGLKCIHDDDYDKLENEYVNLSNELDLPCSAADAVGFPGDSPSGRMVIEKFRTNKQFTPV
jgi:hypothetical protein